MTDTAKDDNGGKVLAVRQLPEPVQRRGITEAQWLTLCNTLYPGAESASVLLVWDYCAARKLDPMKKPVHIVPMRVKDSRSGQWGWRDVVMPGIYEYRITAHRTGLYLGHTEPEFGEEIDHKGVQAFEWCAMTFFRWNDIAKQKVAFPVKVWFREVVATKQDGTVNDRWTRAAIQMHTKCTEAAGLRETFPEEFGGEPTAEEMDGRVIQPMDEHGTEPVPVSPGLTIFERLSDAFRETLEKAFATLNMPGGARLAKLNEYFTADRDPEESAQVLLDWCRDEFAKRKTGQPRLRKGHNAKTAPVPPDAVASAPQAPAADPPVGESAAPSKTETSAPKAVAEDTALF